jgi:hypothetical protein
VPKQNPYKKSTYNTAPAPISTSVPPPVPPPEDNTYSSGNSVYYLSVIVTILVILAFIGGQIWNWMRYNKFGDFFIFSNIVNAIGNVGFNDFIYAVISSVGLGVSTILMVVSANKMDDYFSPWTFALTFLPFCVFAVVVPVFSGIALLIYSIIILIVVSVFEEDFSNNITAGLAFGVITLLCIIVGIIGAVHPSAQIEKGAYEISAFSEIDRQMHSETIALNISGMDEADCGTITTGKECLTLVLIGNKNKTYQNLIIVTDATKIVLKNICIADGYLEINSSTAEVEIYGFNKIVGISGLNGSRGSGSGASGSSGESGKATIYANEIAMSGNGRIELFAGNGGNGGNGIGGDSAFWLALGSSGENGGNGGNGGNSGYVIECEIISGETFSGKLLMKKGTAGIGGKGGDGGSGAWLGASGRDGWDGSNGKILDYVSGLFNLSPNSVIYVD